MRDLGTHVLPVVSALPGTGVAGQHVSYQGSSWYWNAAFSMWQPVDDCNAIILSTAYSNATTTLSTLFTFNAAASATYEVDFRLIWSTMATLTGLKLALVSPTSSTQVCLAKVAGSASGTAAPSFLSLSTSGTAQSSGNASSLNVTAFADGQALIRTSTTAGAITLQAAASGTGTVNVGIGSRLEWRRL